MLENFVMSFGPLDDDGREVVAPKASAGQFNARNLRQAYGGASFRQGLYRLIGEHDVSDWNARVEAYFSEYTEEIDCFAYDWLGRAFAVRHTPSADAASSVLMLEPGTGEVLEIPGDLAEFHDAEIISYPDAALASEFHAAWLKSGGAVPSRSQCVGYRLPLFLGGADDITNLEIVDLDVYWHLLGQLRNQTKDLPPGTDVKVGLVTDAS